jgi:hypothetical protein
VIHTPLLVYTKSKLLDVTWADVKRQLAVEDHLEVEGGSAVEGNVTPSAFVVAALELEDAQ